MEFYNSKDIKSTRKDHKCHLCELDIPKQSSCFYESGKFDDDFFSRYSHNECAKLWVDMNKYTEEDNWLEFRDMAEADPDCRFSDWQKKIGEIYNVLDGDGL